MDAPHVERDRPRVVDIAIVAAGNHQQEARAVDLVLQRRGQRQAADGGRLEPGGPVLGDEGGGQKHRPERADRPAARPPQPLQGQPREARREEEKERIEAREDAETLAERQRPQHTARQVEGIDGQQPRQARRGGEREQIPPAAPGQQQAQRGGDRQRQRQVHASELGQERDPRRRQRGQGREAQEVAQAEPVVQGHRDVLRPAAQHGHEGDRPGQDRQHEPHSVDP